MARSRGNTDESIMMKMHSEQDQTTPQANRPAAALMKRWGLSAGTFRSRQRQVDAECSESRIDSGREHAVRAAVNLDRAGRQEGGINRAHGGLLWRVEKSAKCAPRRAQRQVPFV